MKIFLLVFVVLFMAMPGYTDIASTSYVSNSTATKVDTSANVNQTMAGSYTVSGTLVVPTPPLPSAE